VSGARLWFHRRDWLLGDDISHMFTLQLSAAVAFILYLSLVTITGKLSPAYPSRLQLKAAPPSDVLITERRSQRQKAKLYFQMRFISLLWQQLHWKISGSLVTACLLDVRRISKNINTHILYLSILCPSIFQSLSGVSNDQTWFMVDSSSAAAGCNSSQSGHVHVYQSRGN